MFLKRYMEGITETGPVISDSDVSVIPGTPSATKGLLYKSKMIIMAISTLAEHLDFTKHHMCISSIHLDHECLKEY